MSLFRDDGIVPPTKKLGEAVPQLGEADRIMLCLPGGQPPDPRPKARGGAR